MLCLVCALVLLGDCGDMAKQAKAKRVTLLGSKRYLPRKHWIHLTLWKNAAMTNVKGFPVVEKDFASILQNQQLRDSDGQFYLCLSIRKDSGVSFGTILQALKRITRNIPADTIVNIYVVVERAVLQIPIKTE